MVSKVLRTRVGTTFAVSRTDATVVEWVRYVCCMVFTMGIVSSLVVNGTPFMKFDGYHVLSEWLAWPNLYADGQAAMHSFVAKILKPWRTSAKSHRPLLIIYGMVCAMYRFTFWLALLLGSFLAFHALGMLVIGSLIVAYVMVPILRQWVRAFRQGSVPGQPPMSLRQSLVYHGPTIAWNSVLALSLGGIIFWMLCP
jgi:hypothetical protein